MKETTTQVLQRLEKKWDERACCASSKEYENHCEAIDNFIVVVPQLVKDMKEAEKQRTVSNDVILKLHTRLTIVETQRETEKKMVIGISGVVGIISGFLAKYL